MEDERRMRMGDHGGGGSGWGSDIRGSTGERGGGSRRMMREETRRPNHDQNLVSRPRPHESEHYSQEGGHSVHDRVVFSPGHGSEEAEHPNYDRTLVSCLRPREEAGDLSHRRGIGPFGTLLDLHDFVRHPLDRTVVSRPRPREDPRRPNYNQPLSPRRRPRHREDHIHYENGPSLGSGARPGTRCPDCSDPSDNDSFDEEEYSDNDSLAVNNGTTSSRHIAETRTLRRNPSTAHFAGSTPQAHSYVTDPPHLRDSPRYAHPDDVKYYHDDNDNDNYDYDNYGNYDNEADLRPVSNPREANNNNNNTRPPTTQHRSPNPISLRRVQSPHHPLPPPPPPPTQPLRTVHSPPPRPRPHPSSFLPRGDRRPLLSPAAQTLPLTKRPLQIQARAAEGDGYAELQRENGGRSHLAGGARCGEVRCGDERERGGRRGR